MKLGAVAGALVLIGAAPAWSQMVQYGPGASGGVSQSGSVTAGHVATWAGSGEIQDSGSTAGTGTVTSVALTVPSWLTVSGAPVTTAGTLAITGNSQVANQFLASPSGAAGAVAPRAISGPDLPAPGPVTLGGIESLAAAPHQWLDSVSTAGTPHASQPACADLSNAATSCSVDATNAVNISSGTLAASRLPTTLTENTTFSGNNTYTGASKWNGSLSVPIRVVTAAGPVTVSTTTDYLIVIDQTTPAVTVVNYSCQPGFTFLVKDGSGSDAAKPITLTPASGAIDGGASFVMNASTLGSPPYDARAITCDNSGNSWVN